jgi:hypothetical protein
MTKQKQTFVVFDDLGRRNREVQAVTLIGAKRILGATTRRRTVIEKALLKFPEAHTLDCATGHTT